MAHGHAQSERGWLRHGAMIDIDPDDVEWPATR
jgi:hypothetical protein